MLGYQSLGMENYDPMGEYQTMELVGKFGNEDPKRRVDLLFGLVIAKVLVKALQ